MSNERPNTERKALTINLDQRRYGTFAEIGAGQEVVRWFFRVGGAAYTPDLHDIPEESWPALENLDLWIVDGLRYAGHPSHFSVSDTLSWIERFKPKRAVITNMHSDLDYEVLRQSLPPEVIPAYDGMRLTVQQAG